MPAHKRLQKGYASFNPQQVYPLKEALDIVKSWPQVKFDETIEIALNLNIDPKKPDQNARGALSLPHGTGKDIRVAVFARPPKDQEAKEAGADKVGNEDLAQEIEKGNIDFQRCIATPDMMGVVGRLGKVLGPRGLMPNPKLGTVTFDIAQAVRAAKGGKIEYRSDKGGVVHAGLGKKSFSNQHLYDNVFYFVSEIVKNKPSGLKSYIKKITLSSTMGPSLLLDFKDLLQVVAKE